MHLESGEETKWHSGRAEEHKGSLTAAGTLVPAAFGLYSASGRYSFRATVAGTSPAGVLAMSSLVLRFVEADLSSESPVSNARPSCLVHLASPLNVQLFLKFLG